MKVILNEGLNITDEQGMDSDEEQRVSDHLSPQALLEAQAEEVQYSYRSPEGRAPSVIFRGVARFGVFTARLCFEVMFSLKFTDVIVWCFGVVSRAAR